MTPTVEAIKILLVKRGMSQAALARAVGTSPQNFSVKMNRATFSEEELSKIAAALGCSYRPVFVLNDTGEEVKAYK